MASSWLRAIYRKIRHPTGFAGWDLEGNAYYERANPLSSAGYSRTKRSVKYRHPDDMWNYIGGSKRLPIQWSAWLAHTRVGPPTIQELQMDLSRQQRVQENAALIEASFQQERAQMRLLESNQSDVRSEEMPSISTADSRSSEVAPKMLPLTTENTPSASDARQRASSLPKTGSDEYQPESWTPKLGVKRGG
ncbi:hypothetical protein D9757_004114 [Collybiopsis confluens]|uniref:NADH dehydrogenase [ubiquinone] 1 alpha subcomplex subunit 12 n=1 Tax=Collybiopsis confluens TaxID=2823264 RepID=A0A8H5HUH3_9AGAR|nr:hypothetical protein D9757_004114 [Collybiopsis confluens]